MTTSLADARRCALACAAFLATHFMAFGQAARPAAATAAGAGSRDDETVLLKEFVVTDDADHGYLTPNAIGVTRTNEALIDIPQTINVLNQQFLEDFNPVDLNEVLQFVAGVTAESNVGESSMVRGYTVRDQFTDGMVDNQNQSQLGAEPYQFQRVEVIKGPAGLIYGSTEIGGVTNRVRKTPQWKRRGEIAFTFGSYNQTKTEFDYTTPLSRQVAVRLVATYRDEDLVNGVPTRFAYANRWNANPSLTWRPVESVQVRVFGEFLTERQAKHWGEAGAFAAVTNPNQRTVAPAAAFPFYGKREVAFGVPQAQGGISTWGLLPRNFTFTEQQAHSINYKQAGGLFFEAKPTPDWILRIGGTVSFWDHFVEDILPVGMAGNNREMTRLWREIRNIDFYSNLAIDTAYTFKLLGGEHRLFGVAQHQVRDLEQFIYQHNPARPIPNLDIFNPVYAPYDGRDKVRTNNQLSKQHNYSAGFKDHIKFFGDKFQVAGGPRFDRYTARTDNNLTGAIGRTNKGEVWTFNYGAVFKPTKSYSLFYGHTETYNPVFGAQPDGEPFPAQIGQVDEIGIKLAFLDGRIGGTISTYDLRRTNILVPDPDPLRAAAGWRVDTGEQVTKGHELDVWFAIIRGWNLNIGVSDIRVTTMNGVMPRGVATNTANLSTSYKFLEGPLKGLGIGGGIAYKDKFNVQAPGANDRLARFYLPDYTNGTAWIKYRWQNYTFQLNVINPTNEWYLQRSVNKDITFQGPVRQFRFRIARTF